MKDTIDNLLKELKYNKEDGNFYWVTPKLGRPTDRPAGTTNHKGYTQISYDGQVFMASRLVWYLHTGELPDGTIGYKDNNPRNTQWDNLKMVSNMERTLNFRNAVEPSKRQPVLTKKVRRAMFSNQDVTKAIEEFIKDKVLVEGVYVVRNEHTEALAKQGVSS